jgi:hypothetical protein
VSFLGWNYSEKSEFLLPGRVKSVQQFSSTRLKTGTQALAYSASRSSPKIAHLNSIYTCTYAILFFGTPHSGANKARLLGSLQKLVSLAIPKAAVQFESSLLNALEQESETLQNITDQFAPLMGSFRVFFFWEQEKLDLKYSKEYIVDESSAAPIIDGTERCGIAADHRAMVQFDKNSLQGFRTVVSAIKRYCQEAPESIRMRYMQSMRVLSDSVHFEAMMSLQSIQTWPTRAYVASPPYVPENPASQRGLLGRVWTVQSDNARLLEGPNLRGGMEERNLGKEDLQMTRSNGKSYPD